MSAAPQLRGLLATSTKKHAIACLILTTATVLTFKHFWVDARRKRLEDFYKNYDAEKEFQRMRKAGIFQAAPPE